MKQIIANIKKEHHKTKKQKKKKKNSAFNRPQLLQVGIHSPPPLFLNSSFLTMN